MGRNRHARGMETDLCHRCVMAEESACSRRGLGMPGSQAEARCVFLKDEGARVLRNAGRLFSSKPSTVFSDVS